MLIETLLAAVLLRHGEVGFTLDHLHIIYYI